MSRNSSARLAGLMADVVAIEKARLDVLLAELADARERHSHAVEALTSRELLIPPAMAALSCRAAERRLLASLDAVSLAEQKLLEDGCQLKLFEGRAADVALQEAANIQRDQLADAIERLAARSVPFGSEQMSEQEH